MTCLRPQAAGRESPGSRRLPVLSEFDLDLRPIRWWEGGWAWPQLSGVACLRTRW
jgi:hypothetical protein